MLKPTHSSYHFGYDVVYLCHFCLMLRLLYLSCLSTTYAGQQRDRGQGVPSFDEIVAIVLEEVDIDDPTTNVRGRRALAIAKPTPRGY